MKKSYKQHLLITLLYTRT